MIPFQCRTTDGVAIAGAVFPSAEPCRGVAVLAHGLPAGKPPPAEADTDEGYPGLARQVAALGLDTVIFNFRGTGESGGHLDIDCWPLDLGAVLDFLDGSERRRPHYLVVGFSAGGAAALLRAGQDARIDPLVTMAAPADYSFLPVGADAERWFQFYRDLGMIRDGYPGTAASWAARFLRLDGEAAMPRIAARTIVLVHGADDEVVPPDHAARLAAAAGARAQTIMLPGIGHQLRRDLRAQAALLNVLARLVTEMPHD